MFEAFKRGWNNLRFNPSSAGVSDEDMFPELYTRADPLPGRGRFNPSSASSASSSEKDEEDAEILQRMDEVKEARRKVEELATQMENLKKKVKYNVKNGWLPTQKDDLATNVATWVQRCSSPAEYLSMIAENWFSSTETVRNSCVSLALFENPGIISKYCPNMPFNTLHVGIQIEDHIIDWRCNSLVYPKSVSMAPPLLQFDLGKVTIKRIAPYVFSSKGFDALCEGIAEWNLKKTYDILNSNCIHFATDIIRRLQTADSQISTFTVRDGDHALELYYKHLFTAMRGEKVIPKSILSLLNEQSEDIVFSSHLQFDTWLQHILANHNQLEDFPNLKKLLMAYDNAFRREKTNLGLLKDITIGMIKKNQLVTDAGSLAKSQAKINQYQLQLARIEQQLVTNTSSACPFLPN